MMRIEQRYPRGRSISAYPRGGCVARMKEERCVAAGSLQRHFGKTQRFRRWTRGSSRQALQESTSTLPNLSESEAVGAPKWRCVFTSHASEPLATPLQAMFATRLGFNSGFEKRAETGEGMRRRPRRTPSTGENPPADVLQPVEHAARPARLSQIPNPTSPVPGTGTVYDTTGPGTGVQGV